MKLQFIKNRIEDAKIQFIHDLLEKGHSQDYAEVQWQVCGGEENAIHSCFVAHSYMLTTSKNI